MVIIIYAKGENDMSSKTDYHKMWRGAQKENMMIVNAFTRLKANTNRVIEIHNRQGAMIKDLIDGKVTAEESATIRAAIAAWADGKPTPAEYAATSLPARQ